MKCKIRDSESSFHKIQYIIKKDTDYIKIQLLAVGKISTCCYIEKSVVFVFFFLILLSIQNISIICRMIKIHEVFQPEEQISNSAFCQFMFEFLSYTLHVSQALLSR